MAKKKVVEEEIMEEEKVVEEPEIDWKLAADKLKKLVNDQSIDAYFKRGKVQALRERYNNKDRSQELFDLIMED